MKKLAAVSTLITYFSAALSTFAQQINILKPSKGYSDLGEFINNAITLIFIVAVIAVLIMLVWGAMQWIFSGGEKEAVASARGRIINALIGLAILAVAAAVAQLAGQFVGFNLFGTFTIPGPGRSGGTP